MGQLLKMTKKQASPARKSGQTQQKPPETGGDRPTDGDPFATSDDADWLGARLRDVYNDVVEETLPEDFLAILNELDKAEDKLK